MGSGMWIPLGSQCHGQWVVDTGGPQCHGQWDVDSGGPQCHGHDQSWIASVGAKGVMFRHLCVCLCLSLCVPLCMCRCVCV